MAQKTSASQKIQSETAAQLWQMLQDKAGLELSDRDAELKKEILQILGLDPDLPVTVQLETDKVSINELLKAFYSCITPYAKMMNDLMVLFEQAGAHTGEDNLLLRFNFDEKTPSLDFDMRSFRIWKQESRDVLAEAKNKIWNFDSLQKMCGILEELAGEYRILSGYDNELAWLKEYNEFRKWPSRQLDPILFGSSDFQAVIRHVWITWQLVVSNSRSLGNSRDQLKDQEYQPNQIENISKEVTLPIENSWMLMNLDRNDWAGRMLSAILLLSTKVLSEDMEETIIQAYEAVPHRDVQVIQRIESLIEFLQLPVWKQRYELYSAWVATCIVKVIGEDVKVHASAGRLEFSFKGSQIATQDNDTKSRIHLWAEMRSSLESPKGKGRSKSIQPDYSVLTEPVTFPESAVAVVEVKHYLRPSAGKFAEALEDYARGRPNALVILVNYGHVKTNVIDRVAKEFRDRCKVIGEFRPDHQEAMQEFQDLLLTALSKLPESESPSKEPVQNANEQGQLPNTSDSSEYINHEVPIGKIKLEWATGPEDLDLHIWLSHQKDGSSHVFYKSMGHQKDFPYAVLEHDQTVAPGQEVINLYRIPDSMICSVHNFSKEQALTQATATIMVSIENKNVRINCPVEGEGTWWHAWAYQPAKGSLEILNRITNDPPNELISS